MIKKVFVLSILVLTHYFFWVFWSQPVPEMDGLAQYYYPLLNYLQAASFIGNDYSYLTSKFFGQHYPHGAAVIAWLISFFGVEQLILKEPYIVNLLLIFPVIGSFFFYAARKHWFLTGLIFYFFPVVQICLKLFSLQGINVIYAFLSFLFLRSWLVYHRRTFLAGFIVTAWFSAIAKHLGLLFFLCLFVSYVTWALRNQRHHFSVYLASAIVLALSYPFYCLPTQFDYIRTSVAHNPHLPLSAFMTSALSALVLPPFLALCLARFTAPLPLPKLFRHGFLLFFLLLFSFFVLVSNYLSSSFFLFLGGIVVFSLLCFCNLQGVRGFVYIFIFLSLTVMCSLYRSGAAQVPYTLFLPLLVICGQTISETASSRFLFILALICFMLSNFFPNIHFLDQKFAYFGRRIYTAGFKSPHQNPLGWQKYYFGELKKEVIAELSTYSFAKEPLFLVENFGPLTGAQFVFFRNVLYSFPLMELLVHSDYQSLYADYQEYGTDLFQKLVENADVPIFLYAIIDLPEEEMTFRQKITLDELISAADFSIEQIEDDFLARIFNEAFISWAEQKGVLDTNYNCLNLPKERPFARLCVSAAKRTSLADDGRNYAVEFLQEIQKDY